MSVVFQEGVSDEMTTAAGGAVPFQSVCLSVCVSVCLSVCGAAQCGQGRGPRKPGAPQRREVWLLSLPHIGETDYSTHHNPNRIQNPHVGTPDEATTV